MKDYETLKVTREGNVVTAVLDRPESKNAINMKMVNELTDLMKTVESAQDLAVLVFRGCDGVFSSGIDLRDFKLDQKADIYGLQKWEKMLRQMERLNKFTVAAVEGECTGGGFQLVLVCDARISAKRSQFRFDEVKKGFLPGMAIYRLAKYIGLGRAKNLILTGRTLTAEQALEWGVLDQVCEEMELDKTLQETIDTLLPFHPVALEMARRLINECFAEEYEDFIGHFLAAQHRSINSDAFQRLIAKATR
ncbi:enoyl-CoA hydratase/isomerase family protein [Acidobacteriota bacterium]